MKSLFLRYGIAIGAIVLLPAVFAAHYTAQQPPAGETILFVCEHGAAKSIIAAAYFNRLAKERGLKINAVARGTAPDPALGPAAVKGLKEDGLEIGIDKPQLVSQKDIADAARVVTFGCALPDNASSLAKVTDWNDVPAVGQNYGAARTEIVNRVQRLVESLAARQTEAKPAGPQMPEAHFHHLHLNTTDPAKAIEFYTSRFDSEKARFAGLMDAVWAQKSWLLFTKVAAAPPWELTSAVWHFGWGAENMKAEYERQLKLGTKFFTELTDISDIGGNTGAKDLFYYAYVQSPDNALIELNTAQHHNFGHLHLFSADPIAAGEWYVKYFGAKRRSTAPPRREPRFYRGVQIGPASSVMMDNVNIIIYPLEYSKKAYPDQWKGKTEIDSTKGRVMDHVGFSFDNLAEALELLRKDGVKVTDEIRSVAGGKIKFAFIEGPDKIRIELVEGHAKKE